MLAPDEMPLWLAVLLGVPLWTAVILGLVFDHRARMAEMHRREGWRDR